MNERAVSMPMIENAQTSMIVRTLTDDSQNSISPYTRDGRQFIEKVTRNYA